MKKLGNGNYEITEKELKEFLTLKHKTEALSMQMQGDWDDIYSEAIDEYLECYNEEKGTEVSSIEDVVNYEMENIK